MKRFRSMWAKERRVLKYSRRTMYVAGVALVILQLLPTAVWPPRFDKWWSRELQLLGFGVVVWGLTNMVAELRLKFPRYYFYKLLDEKVLKLLNGREPGPRCAMQITIFDPDAAIDVRAHDFYSMPGMSDAERAQVAALMKRERKEWTN